MLKDYYMLAKPGIIYGNDLTALAGFLLASQGHVQVGLLIATLLGISLVIGSACAFNNYMDRDIDKVMARTKKRALVAGTITPQHALVFASVLGIAGFSFLALYTNALTVLIGIIGFLDYIWFYGWSKRKSVHGTVVGSISGAAPIVAGYTAVSGKIDAAAIILFLILVFWQMPHFYAIAIYRRRDYKAAGLPVLPVKKTIKEAKIQMVLYILAFNVALSLLTSFGYTSYGYLFVMMGLGLVWLWFSLQGFKAKNDGLWARKMFFFSLIIILALSFTLSLSGLLA